MTIRAMLLAATLVLAGCIDAEVTMDFTDGETMQGELRMDMARQLFDMMGQSPEEFCDGGDAVVSADSISCVTRNSATIAEVLAGNGAIGPDSEFNPAEAARIEEIGKDRLRITFDFRQAMADNTSAPSLEELGGMQEVVRAAMAGHSFILRIRAPEIVTTTGTLSEDRTQAEYVIPIVRFLDAEPDLGPPFVTEIDLSPSCFLWVFCG
jgi:hypothetical protein